MASSDPGVGARQAGRGYLIAGAVLGAGVVIALWNGAGRLPGNPVVPSRATRLTPEPALDSFVVPAAMTRESALASGPATAPESSLAPGPAVRTAADFLAGYYGDQWPEIRERIEAAGQVSLDTPYSFTPWEDVELEFLARLDMTEESRASLVRNKLQWPSELDATWLRQEYSLSPERFELTELDVEEIRARVAAKNQEITQRAELFAQKLDFYVHEKWYEGAYVRAPFTTSGLVGSGFHSQSHAGFGWAATITLTYEEYPDMQDLDREMSLLVDQREGAVADYLRSRIRR